MKIANQSLNIKIIYINNIQIAFVNIHHEPLQIYRLPLYKYSLNFY